MKFEMKHDQSVEQKVTFEAYIDSDGDFRVTVSNGKGDTSNLLFISKSDGILNRFGFSPGLQAEYPGLKFQGGLLAVGV